VDGALGCSCNTFGDFVSIKIPVEVSDEAVETLSLDPAQRAAIHCRCTKEVEALLLKATNVSSQRGFNLTLIEPRPGSDLPDFSTWTAALVPGIWDSMISLAQRSGVITEKVPMILSAASLAETSGGASYRAQILVNLSADLSAIASANASADECRQIVVGVKTSVLAMTSARQTVWGWVPRGMPCSAAEPPAEGLREWTLPIKVGQERSVAFTACDNEGLAVEHELPTTRQALPDPRAFSAALFRLPSGASQPAEIVSHGGGRYTATIRATTPGRMSVGLRLGSADDVSVRHSRAIGLRIDGAFPPDEDATPLLGALEIEASCSDGLIEDPETGGCTCDAGREPVGAGPFTETAPQTCRPCEQGYFKPTPGAGQCEPCPAGSMQPDEGGRRCISCFPGTFQDAEGQAQCKLCATRTTSVAPYRDCTECAAGSVRDSVAIPPSQETCRPCHPLAECTINSTTLPTMSLKYGAWRLSPFSHMLEECEQTGAGVSPCVGGDDSGTDGDGYCRSGHSGFRCQVCADGFFFSVAQAGCITCSPIGRTFLMYLALLGSPVLAFILFRIARRQTEWTRLHNGLRKLTLLATGSGLFAKIRILIGFAQIAGAATMYSIIVPRALRDLLLVLSWFELDIWNEPFLSHACAGGYLNYMLLTACFPVGVLLLITAGCIVRRVCSNMHKTSEGGKQTMGAAIVNGLLAALKPTLATVTILTPTVNHAAFGAFHCRQVVSESDPLEYRTFLWSSSDIECNSAEAARLRAAAIAILVVWPAGSLIGLAVLLVAIRKAVTKHSPSKLSTASKVLWSDFRVGQYWWGLVEHFRRIVLTGVLLFIPEYASFIRLIAALLFALGCMLLQMMLRPYVRMDIGALSMAEQAVSFVLILGYSFIYLYQRFSVFLPTDVIGVNAVGLVLGFQSDDAIAITIVIIVLAMASVIVLVALRQWLFGAKHRIFLLKDTMQPPVLTMKQGHRHHLFLSHVWSTGQDQVAAPSNPLVPLPLSPPSRLSPAPALLPSPLP
jgi:hypothetical protein